MTDVRPWLNESSTPPWPPPGVGSPPTPPAAADAPSAAPPPPTQAQPVGPTGPDRGDEPTDDDRFRPARWVYIVIPFLVLALLAALWLSTRGDDDSDEQPADTIAPTSTAPPGVTTAPGGTAPPTGSAPSGGTTVPGATTVPGPATAPATTAPGTPGATAPGAPSTSVAAGPTSPSGPPASAPAPTAPPTPTERALVVAQDMAAALADGDWPLVRRLSPTDRRSVAELEEGYAGLDASTVVLADASTLSSGLVDMRVGIVAHESRPSGPQTSLFCAHWIVDPAARTVQRLDAARLRTEGGTIAVSQVAGELAATCAAISLR